MSIILDGTTGVTTPGNTVSGNLLFTGTGNRITGDFSNATLSNRVTFQSSTTNGNTGVDAIPNGTATVANFTALNSSDPNNASYAQLRAGSADIQIQSGITGTGTLLPMTFYTGGSERVRIDTSGNVGIGTSSPGSKLHIANGYIRSSDGTNAYYFDFGREGADGYFRFDGNQGLGYKWLIGGTERARIDSSGRVGIGLSSPSYQLHVASASEWPIAIRYASDTQGNRAGMLVQRSRGSLASPTTVNANTNLGGIEVGGYNGTSYTSGWNGGGALFFFAEDTWTASSNPTYIGFHTTASGSTSPTERMRITSDGSIRQSGDNARTVQLVKGIATTVSSITVDVTGGDDNTNYLVEIEMAGYLGIFLKYIHTVYKTNSWTNYGPTVIQNIAPVGVSVAFSSPSFGVLRYVITASTTYPVIKAKVTSGGSSINPTVSLSIY